MLEKDSEIKKIASSIIRYFEQEKNFQIIELLKNARVTAEEIRYDYGVTVFALQYEIEIENYRKNRSLIEVYQDEILNIAHLFVDDYGDEQIGAVTIKPACRLYLNWNNLPEGITKNVLVKKIRHIHYLMIQVATNEVGIKDVDDEYQRIYKEVARCLHVLDIENPNPYRSLWEWYQGWKAEGLGTYAQRRTYLARMYTDLLKRIENDEPNTIETYAPTGWDRVDRTIYSMQTQLSSAYKEEEFQQIGLLGRETLITIAQKVYNRDIHKSTDDVEPSDTDAKRMLDAYICYSIPGPSNERLRKFAKSAIDLANNLTHDRMASRKDAEMCLTAVTAVAKLIRILDSSTTHTYIKDGT